VYPPPVWAGERVKGRREEEGKGKERKEKGKGGRMKGGVFLIRRGEAHPTTPRK